ncbi:sialic acid-binding Ig-like lectin 15 isoform X2 [Rhinatrema bivittatum]|uniref:sialic acid-binding Ig-like lectin 15 isoform X2 n=1 Tax=Rhinatrema bivittatum TaxID=194408 RepID=UPI001128780B|nr:sialic acid-binding Ig-like lectin 15 isoform X2 [Rhinatrema bivittatum]
MTREISSLLGLLVCFRGIWLGSPASSGFSMNVSLAEQGVKGGSAVLPCVFSREDSAYHGPIVVIWRTDFSFLGPEVFRCSVTNGTSGGPSPDNCTAWGGKDGRYRLEGDPRRYNLSLQIRRLAFDDSRNYYCRVELTEIEREMWTNTTGTNLTVVAPPTILNLTLHGNVYAGRWAECVAEGLPLPNITWDRPEKSETPTPPPQEVKFANLNQTLGNLTVTQNGTYTCRAQNVYGQDERRLEVGEMPSSHTVMIAVGLVLLLLLFLGTGIVCFIHRRKEGSLLCWKVSTRVQGNLAINSHHSPSDIPGAGSPVSKELPRGPHDHKEDVTGKSEDGCTYADIQFTTTQGKGKERGGTSPRLEAGEVTYAAVMTQAKAGRQVFLILSPLLLGYISTGTGREPSLKHLC